MPILAEPACKAPTCATRILGALAGRTSNPSKRPIFTEFATSVRIFKRGHYSMARFRIHPNKNDRRACLNGWMATVTEQEQPGLHNLTKRQLVGTLAGLLLTLLLAALDQTIVGTAMPRIISQLNGFDRYPWV